MDTPIQSNLKEFKFDLQLFSEDITPTEPTAPVEPTEPVTPTEPTEPTTPTEIDYSPFLQTLSERAKYNGEVPTIESFDDVVVNFQKGLNYDKVNERYQALQNDPRLSFVQELAENSGYDNIEEYMEAAREWQYQQQLKDLLAKNIPEEYAKEMLESRKFREEQKAEKKAKAEEEAKNKQFHDFLDYYKQANGREYTAEDTIPQEVIEQAQKGEKSLKEAYMEYENKELKNRLTKLEETLNIRQKNEENIQSSTGSVTGNGSVPTGYITKEQAKAMSQKETMENYDAIIESMKHWK